MPTAYQLWLEDQKKKQQDVAQGKVNFREASTASRPQYSLPAYSSRDSSSDNTTYQWEKDLLGGMKGKKIGRSYEDKFQTLAKSLGLSDGRANDFRNFLNFQEDSKTKIQLNKDGTPAARQSVPMGQGAHVNMIDSILNDMQKRGVASVQAADQKQQEFEANQQKLQDNLPKERTGVLGFLDSTLGRAGQMASSLFGQDFVNAQNENYANLAMDKLKKDTTDSRSLQQIQILNNLTRAPKNNTEKAADFVGNTTAAMAPYVMGGAPGVAEGVLSKVGLNSIKNPLVKDLVRGLGTGFVGGNERQVLQAIGNGQPPSDNEYAKGVLTETALGGAGDAVLGAFGRNINLKGQLDELMSQTKSVPYSQESFQKALQDAFSPKGDVSNVVNSAKGLTGGQQQFLQQMAEKYKSTKPAENVQQLQQDLQHLHTQRQAYEDAHVQEVMQPFLDTAKKQADAQLQWENSVKTAKSEIERIKGTYGKISVPKGDRADYNVPPQFRASLKDKHSNDIYSFATQEGFSSVDDAVKYLQSLEKDSKVKLKDIMPDGTPLTNDHFKALEDLARKDFAGTDGGKAIDNLITNLLNIHSDATKSRTTVRPEPIKPLSQAIDELNKKYEALGKSKGNEKAYIKERDALYQEYAKNGKNATPTLDAVTPQPALDKALQSLGQEVKPTETPVKQDIVNNSQEVSKPSGRLRLNLQEFNTDAQPQLFATGENAVSKSPIDSIKNPFMRAFNRVYEHIASPTREASVAEIKILEDKITRLKADGNAPAKVAQLEQQLKQVKKSGSDYSKALENQQAAAAQSQVFSKRHVQNLQDALGSTKTKDMSDALHWYVAKNVDWVRNKGGKPNYELGKEWDQGRINQLLNLEHDSVKGPKLQEFAKAFRQWVQERLDVAYKYNMINKNQYDALSKNPYYIPLSRDVSGGLDNITRGLTSKATGNVASADAYFIHSLDQGSADALVKNPLETMIMGDFSLFKNAAKADTAQQVYRLAKLNKGAAVNDRFIQEVPKSKSKDPNVIEVPTPKGTKYVQVQDDLMNIMREAEMPQDLDALGKVTSLIASLKTRSFEFQFTNVIRDLKDGYLKGQVSANPFKYGAAIWKAALERNASAKEVGAFFEHANKDGMGGINQEKMIQEFARRYTGGKVHTVSLKNPKTWSNVLPIMEKALDKVTKPIKVIGQFSDELPRTVEVNETKRLFMKKYGDQINRVQSRLDLVNQQLNDAQGIQDPFDPRLKGIDNLKNQKVKLENILNQFDKNLRREQTYRGRDIMNFQRVGRGKLTKRIKQYVMYANTTTQAKDKLIRSVIERPVQTMTKMAILTSPFVISQYTHYQNSSDSDKAIADNLPFWLKEFNYTYVQDGNLYTVPKNQELAILLNPIEAAMIGDKQGVNDALRAAVKEAVPLQLGNFMQGLVPNTDGSMTMLKNSTVPGFGFSPILDVKANEKLGLNSNPISIQDYFHRKDPKANKYTMDVFKKIFGDKPRADYAQYLAQYLPGDYGKYGVNIADFLNDPSNQSKLDAVIQNLNPLQDRIYGKATAGGHQVFKNVPQKSKVTKK